MMVTDHICDLATDPRDSVGRGLARRLLVWSAPFVLLLAPPVSAVDVGLKTIDGRSMSGTLVEISDAATLKMTTGGQTKTISLDQLSTLSFTAEIVAPPFQAEFVLADGSRVPGRILREANDGIVCRLSVADEVELSFDQLAAIRFAAPDDFPKAASLFGDALASRRPGNDVVISRSDSAARAVPGRLVAFDAQGGTMRVNKQDRKFRLEKVYGIVFAGADHDERDARMTVHLSDGTALVATSVSSQDDTVRLTAASGFKSVLPVDRIHRVTFRNDRVHFLSDMPTIAEKMSGLLHGTWRVRRDRSVSGNTLQLGGRRFEKGLGVHSYTELVYEIDGAYDTFVATIGIDDHVRPAGNVVFRVVGDERALFDSGELNGSDDPQALQLDVRGVRTLTLIVDYGAGLDLSDHANWAGARLIRPANPSQ